MDHGTPSDTRTHDTQLSAVESALAAGLRQFHEQADWYTYDPYDVQAHPMVSHLLTNNAGISRLLGLTIHRGGLLLPRTLRRMLRIRPTLTASGVAYILATVSRLLQISARTTALWTSDHLRSIAGDALERIYQLRNQTRGWGLPFDWHTNDGVTIPKNESLSYTTYTVLDALLDYLNATYQPEVEELVENSLQSLLTELNCLKGQRSGMALSYSRHDRYRVINTNALLAGVLARVATRSRKRWITHYEALAKELVEFVISEQAADGSWSYYGNGKQTANSIDNYHTAMTLQGLCCVWECGYRGPALESSITRGTQFYLDKFVRPNGKPVLRLEKREWLVDIAGCAEGVELLFRWEGVLKELRLDTAKRSILLDWCLTRMQRRPGEWYYRRYGPIGIRLGSLRWGHGMMLRSLAGVYQRLAKCDEI